MKLTLCATTVLALAVSQVMAVIPIPVKECTKSVIVQLTDSTCEEFAERFDVTFDDLLKWNTKLRKDCLNLDVGHPICVSVTPGNCCLNESPSKPVSTVTTTTTTTTARATTTTRPRTTTTTTTTTTVRPATTTTTTTPPPVTTTTTTNAPVVPPTTTTTTVPAVTTVAPPPPVVPPPVVPPPVVPPPVVPPPAVVPTTANSTPPLPSAVVPINPIIIDSANKENNAAAPTGSTKSSMMLAVGVILSVIHLF
ncbi:hypothetical protein BGX24_007678 [Mortierella sp. AD032]|nr:hypothetical protein BGX24_007678 [Mortierella sp. AD032]